MPSRRFVLALPLALAACASLPPKRQMGMSKPIIIAHRGASADRPEHTLASYEEGIAQGADFIEPDLVISRDGVLIARHENEISGTTDVADKPEFASRRAVKSIDGEQTAGWFTEDFTLAELKSLRARERLPQLRPANTRFDGQFQIPTFAEVIALAKAKGVGVYPETKHPSYFRALGLPLEEPLLADLDGAGWNRADAPVFIQSFESGNLQALRRRTPVKLIQLMNDAGQPEDFRRSGDPRTYADMARAEGLRFIASYADGIGPNKAMIIPRDAQARLIQPTALVREAHEAGLKVHPWTFRPESFFLPADFRSGEPADRGDGAAEIKAFLAAGVDGLFADHPADARRALA